MDSFVEPHLHALEDLTRQVVETVTPLDDEQINRTVAGLQNSVGILLRHMAGSERYWIGEVAGGRPAHRNRDSEFGHEPLRKSELLAELERVTALSREVIGGISRDDLMTLVDVQRTKVAKETKAFALMHATQHLAYHLGQLRYLAKLVQAA